MKLKACSYGGVVEDFFPSYRAFLHAKTERVNPCSAKWIFGERMFQIQNESEKEGFGLAPSRGRDLLRQQYLTAKERMPRRKEVHKQ